MRLGQLFEKIPLNHPQNPAFMTWPEYNEAMNPGGKFHGEAAYNWDLEDMNRVDLWGKVIDPLVGVNNDLELVKSAADDTLFLFKKDGYSLIGYVIDSILYIIKGFDGKYTIQQVDHYVTGDLSIKYVKYPMAYFKQKEAEVQRSKYSILVQNTKIKGQSFQIKKDDHDDFAIFNDKAQKIAIAQNEWGAILVSVAKEYRSYGFGTLLGKIYRESHPEANTGGTTAAGSKQVKRVWDKFVREAMADGTYSKLVKSGKITTSRVKEIVKDLDERPNFKDTKIIDYATDHKNWLIMDHGAGALIYHKAIYDKPIDLETADDYIMGYTLIRNVDTRPQPFLFSIDYENKRAETMLLYSSLQISFRSDEGLDTEAPGSDYAESIQNLKHTEIRDGVVYLEQSQTSIVSAFNVEKQYRKPRDKYNEYEYMLLEAAAAKYRI